ncbi:hypothetical protein AAIB41_00860 [Brucella sp. BE17]|uniref:hypothetical protein n=1 Tax=Brucella sp. BE17 TaxID=3142977 RepID=UPI0031B9E35A
MIEKTTLPDLNGILPARDIRIKKHGLANRWFYLFLSIVTGFASVAMVWAWSPNLYRDYLIKNDPMVLEDASIVSGQCRSKKMTVNCEAGILLDPKGERRIQNVEFSFMSLSRGDYETDIVAQKSNPDNVTLSLAIDEFWNRLVTGIVLVGLIAGLSVLFIVRFLHITRSVSAMKSAAALKLGWAKINASKKSFGAVKYTYIPMDKAHKNTIISAFRKEEPFLHYMEEEDETYGVVAIHPKAKFAVLLDEQFERLELNHKERTDLLQALKQRIGA